MKVTLRGALEPKDYVRAMRLTMRPRRWLGVLGLVVGVLYVAIVVFGFIQAVRYGRGWAAALLFLGMGLLLLLYFLVELPRSWRRIFRQQKSLHLPVDVTLDLEGIDGRNATGHARIPWDFICKWRSDRHIVLLYQSDVLMQILPKRLMTDEDARRLESHLRERFGPG